MGLCEGRYERGKLRVREGTCEEKVRVMASSSEGKYEGVEACKCE